MNKDEWFTQKILIPMIVSALTITAALLALGVAIAQQEPKTLSPLLILNITAIILILVTLVVLSSRLKLGLLEEKRLQAAQRDQVRQLAHDLNSPLSVLRLVLEKGLVSQESVGLLKSATDKMTSMLRETDVRHLLEKPNQEISIEEFFAELENLKRTEIGNKSIDFEFNVSNDLKNKSLRLPISRSQLERMCSNLMNNAIEACGKVGVVRINITRNNNALTVALANTGKPIPREVLQAMGQYRISFGKENGNARGYGLKHAFNLMSYARGHLSMRNNSNLGAEVEFTLPIYQVKDLRLLKPHKGGKVKDIGVVFDGAAI